MNSVPRTIALGAAAAAVGTLAKTKAEQVLQPWAEKIAPPSPPDRIRLGADPATHPENMPPSQVVDRAQGLVTGTELTDEQRQAAAAPLHWGMGVSSGIAYALLARVQPRATLGHGAVAGAALFAATHGSSLPAAGVQDAPWRLPAAWWIWEGGSHLFYGLVVDTTYRVLDRLMPA